jgi:hypothetical protein
MLGVEASLLRLRERVSHFVLPSIALQNVHLLGAQIEVRRQALREIQVIRGQLRPFKRLESKRFERRRLARRG